MEQLTWSQLGLHAKPVGLLDVEDYWRPLIALARHATQEGFVRESDLAAIAVAGDAESLLDRLDGMTREERPRPKWSRAARRPRCRRHAEASSVQTTDTTISPHQASIRSMVAIHKARLRRRLLGERAATNTSASACAAAGRTSSTASGRPSSRAIDVNA